MYETLCKLYILLKKKRYIPIYMQQIPIPKLLQEIPDLPKKLYLEGHYPDQEHHLFLTIVGSRKATHYGKEVCHSIIKALKDYPVVIVSGLAVGIDTYAHTYALAYGMPTIAVLGSGLSEEVIYPPSNRPLAKRIVEQGGCLLSEYDPTFTPKKWSFPKRNRIMAGIAHAVLIIEAENTSGSRITAELAYDYNREVLAVPGSIFSKYSAGCNTLITQGAVAICSGADIINYFNLR